jgi:hypothetical protein
MSDFSGDDILSPWLDLCTFSLNLKEFPLENILLSAFWAYALLVGEYYYVLCSAVAAVISAQQQQHDDGMACLVLLEI